MQDRRHISLAIVLLLLVALLSLAGIHWYCSHYVYAGGIHYDLSSTELDFSGQKLESIAFLERFPHLDKLNIQGTEITISQYESLRAAHPDCEILWDVPFQGSLYPSDKKVLVITSLTAEDIAILDYFPQLQYIYAEGCRDYGNLITLYHRRPDCHIYFSVDIFGQDYSYTSTHLTLPGHDLDTLTQLIPFFPKLQSITLTDPLEDVDSLRAFRDAHPDLSVTWQLNIGGVIAEESATTLDLTGVPLTVPEVQRLITYLPNLTYLDLSDCGISNEDMDALRDSYDNLKIVWTVSIGRYLRVKTDITWFMPVKYGVYVTTKDLYNLRYCRDIMCLDIGHMDVNNCDFVAYMPHLKYLLMADTEIYDLTPLTGLTELIYLELFLTDVRDYSPLLTLTALEDLNIHYTWGDPGIIAQMTWLKNLWWKRLDWPTITMLRESLPDTHIEFTCTSSTGGGWRQLENYYAQRDIFGMRYMTG